MADGELLGAAEGTGAGENWVSPEHTQLTENTWVQRTFELTEYITLTDQLQSAAGRNSW